MSITRAQVTQPNHAYRVHHVFLDIGDVDAELWQVFGWSGGNAHPGCHCLSSCTVPREAIQGPDLCNDPGKKASKPLSPNQSGEETNCSEFPAQSRCHHLSIQLPRGGGKAVVSRLSLTLTNPTSSSSTPQTNYKLFVSPVA